MAVTAPKVCPECGAFLDAGEQCDCKEKERILDSKQARTRRMLREDFGLTINYSIS